MSAPARTSQEGTFFVTTVCAERKRVFQRDTSARLMFDVLQHYRSIYKLHAFVIMPEHLHVLLTPMVTLERAMQCIKGGFSKRYHDAGGKHAPVWQRGFADHRVRDRTDYESRKMYIEQNPVSRRLVEDAASYRWSSAYWKKADLSG
ncbi:transposase [Terriglobus roseus DSM 18391]|uniref:Transposase n=1 Tax=Terriglobus roseus (strain DSM 18391 / NRRL B-41598 / KBS 63) TaxID=926566 RepID=I3ZLP2_TERRK|nr:transposase [Terriglobus roseus]AFL90160.1 transposase [Terriglobus roseus DSM 18391]